MLVCHGLIQVMGEDILRIVQEYVVLLLSLLGRCYLMISSKFMVSPHQDRFYRIHRFLLNEGTYTTLLIDLPRAFPFRDLDAVMDQSIIKTIEVKRSGICLPSWFEALHISLLWDHYFLRPPYFSTLTFLNLAILQHFGVDILDSCIMLPILIPGRFTGYETEISFVHVGQHLAIVVVLEIGE